MADNNWGLGRGEDDYCYLTNLVHTGIRMS